MYKLDRHTLGNISSTEWFRETIILRKTNVFLSDRYQQKYLSNNNKRVGFIEHTENQFFAERIDANFLMTNAHFPFLLLLRANAIFCIRL